MRGIFSKLNISKALLTRGVSLVVVFATLVAAYAALSMNQTLGWFAKNETVSANGMITQAYTSTFKVTYTPFEWVEDETTTVEGDLIKEYGTPVSDPNELKTIIENVKVPGQSVYFEIEVQNTGIYAVDLTGVGLEAPSVDDEAPKIVNGVYHYLSTQLTTDVTKVTFDNPELKLGSDDPNADTAQFLRDQSGNATRINYIDWLNQDFVTLDPDASVTLDVVITFKDQTYMDGNQNIFKNFGELDGNGKPINGFCSRKLFITYDE